MGLGLDGTEGTVDLPPFGAGNNTDARRKVPLHLCLKGCGKEDQVPWFRGSPCPSVAGVEGKGTGCVRVFWEQAVRQSLVNNDVNERAVPLVVTRYLREDHKVVGSRSCRIANVGACRFNKRVNFIPFEHIASVSRCELCTSRSTPRIQGVPYRTRRCTVHMSNGRFLARRTKTRFLLGRGTAQRGSSRHYGSSLRARRYALVAGQQSRTRDPLRLGGSCSWFVLSLWLWVACIFAKGSPLPKA